MAGGNSLLPARAIVRRALQSSDNDRDVVSVFSFLFLKGGRGLVYSFLMQHTEAADVLSSFLFLFLFFCASVEPQQSGCVSKLNSLQNQDLTLCFEVVRETHTHLLVVCC